VAVRLPVRCGAHGRFSNCALPHVQEEGLVVGVGCSGATPENARFHVLRLLVDLPSAQVHPRRLANIPSSLNV